MLSISCDHTGGSSQLPEVIPDHAFNAMFSPDSGGITGADGMFSIPLADGRTVFLTGDCFLGEVIEGQRDPGTKMLNNSMVVVGRNGSHAEAIYRGSYDEPESLFIPDQEKYPGHWYWPGHGFATDSILYVFALNMYNDPALMIPSTKEAGEVDQVDRLSENQWAFAVAGVDLLRFSLPELRFLGADAVSSTYESDIHLGNCVLKDGAYLYFFGTRNDPDGSHVYAARTDPENPELHENWEYFGGDNWSPDPERARPMKLDISVSEQFSIFRVKDRYVLLTHEKGSYDIYTYTSDEPHRGYSNKTFIYHSPEPAADPTGKLSAYNALAHPQLSEGNMLLVSYCLNSLRVRDVFEDADKYRGRFIRVPLSLIDTALRDHQPVFRLAMVQMKVEGGQREANLARARSMIDEAAGEGADLILLPEAMDLGWAHPSALSLAEEIPSGAACRMLMESAQEHGVYICGGLVEKDGDMTYNSALLFSPDGEILIHHRKINVLDIAHEYYAQGRDLSVVETSFGSVGLMICADGFAHQRVVSQTLCYMGADMIISPTSWALPSHMAHDSELATEIWYDHYAPVARKFGVYMAGCSNVGELNDGPWKGFHAIGNSLLIDPDGHIAAGGLFGVDAEAIIYHDMMLRPRPVRGTVWLDYFNAQSGLSP